MHNKGICATTAAFNAALMVLATFMASFSSPVSSQQQYPNKPVKVIVQFPPGGAPDLVARTVAQKLSERLGQPFVVENQTGAGGNIATGAVARSAADGYTLLASADAPLVINPHLYRSLPFDTVRDFTPISLVAKSGFVLMACKTLSASTLPEVVQLARSKPGTLTFGSSGNGSNHHLAGEMLKTAAGVNMVHVPYKGFGAAINDLLGCQIDLLFGSIPAALPHIQSGKVKALAQTTTSRTPDLPNVPTMAEAGVPGLLMEAYFGFVAPANTPRAVVDKLNAEISAILKDKEVSERLTKSGLEIVGGPPEDYARRIRTDLASYAKVVEASGAKAE